VPYYSATRKPWGFLTDGVYRPEEYEFEVVAGALLPSSGDHRDSDLARVLERSKQLLAAGRQEATVKDFEGVFGSNNGSSVDRRRLGMAMVALGVRSHRERRGSSQERVYELQSLSG